MIKVEAPFIDEISGLAIIEILSVITHSTMLLKLKFIHNAATLDTARYHNIYARRDVMDIRFDIIRLLQNQAGYTAATFK